MGSYKDRIEVERAGWSLAAIRQAKNVRAHQRNLARRAKWRAEADARNAACRSMSPADRVELLDYRLGRGAGATRERLRLSLAE